MYGDQQAAELIDGLPDKNIFRIDEVAEFFGLTKWAVYKWLQEGKIVAVRLGGSRRITRQALIEFIKSSPLI